MNNNLFFAKQFPRIGATAMAVVLFFCGTMNARAAAELTLSRISVTVTVGGTKRISVTGDFVKIKATAKDSACAEVSVRKSKVVIRGLSAGKTKVRIKAFDKNNTLTAKASVPVKVKPVPTLSEDELAEEYAPDTIHTGDATFYDPSDTGAANLGDLGKEYQTAALNKEDFMNGLAGAYLEVTDADGDVVNVLVTDLLPEGKKGDIDLSRKAFKSIEPPETGRMAVSWHVIALPTDEPVAFLWKPSSSEYWAQVQVRNHRYPIRSLEYFDEAADCFKTLTRMDYNYFEAPDGMGGKGPFIFRITDIYGRSIVEKNVPMKTNGKPVPGTQNFADYGAGPVVPGLEGGLTTPSRSRTIEM